MPEFVYATASSLGGWIADRADRLDWLFAVGHEGGPDLGAFQQTVGVMVEGSTTYEWVLREEALLDQPSKWPDFYGDRPTYVFTSRVLDVPDGADVRFVSGTVEDHLDAIATAAGARDVWLVGGGDLVGQFFEAGALDRVVVTVAPATLGGGAPLLPRAIGSDVLVLEDVARFGQFAELTYLVRR